MAAGGNNVNVSEEREMQSLMALLDEWQAPEPSPWFEARMMARFREEQERAPQGWFARLQDRFRFGDAISYKPMLVGAMALLLMAGGGGYLQMTHLHQQQSRTVPRMSAAVQDLQILDNNDQAIQQMDQLLDANDDTEHI